MPSASTANPRSGLAMTESSLFERTMPGSLRVTISRTAFISMIRSSNADIDAGIIGGGSAASHRHAGADVLRKFRTGLVARVRVLGHRPVDDRHQAIRQ